MESILIDGVIICNCNPDELYSQLKPHIESGKLVVLNFMMDCKNGIKSIAMVRMMMVDEKDETSAREEFHKKFKDCIVYTGNEDQHSLLWHFHNL